jgi:hypothetical protein
MREWREVDFSKLSREDWMVGLGGVVLIIDLLFFAWHSYPLGPLGSADFTGTGSPDSGWGVLALLVTILVVADLAFARFSPQTVVPTTRYGRDFTRAGAAAVGLLFLLLKFLFNTADSAFGCWLGLVLGIVIVAGAWMNAQGRSTPVGHTGPPSSRTNPFQ